MIRLHDYPPSRNRYKVRLLLAQLGIPHEGGFDLRPFPVVRDWLERISSQPSYVSMTEAS